MLQTLHSFSSVPEQKNEAGFVLQSNLSGK